MYGLALRKDSRQGGRMMDYLRNHRILRAIGRMSLSAISGTIIVLVAKFSWKLIEDRIVTEANSQIDIAVEGMSMLDRLQQLLSWYFANVTFLEAVIFPLIAILVVEIIRIKRGAQKPGTTVDKTSPGDRLAVLMLAKQKFLMLNEEAGKICEQLKEKNLYGPDLSGSAETPSLQSHPDTATGTQPRSRPG
jgi:hypothetical protein